MTWRIVSEENTLGKYTNIWNSSTFLAAMAGIVGLKMELMKRFWVWMNLPNHIASRTLMSSSVFGRRIRGLEEISLRTVTDY